MAGSYKVHSGHNFFPWRAWILAAVLGALSCGGASAALPQYDPAAPGDYQSGSDVLQVQGTTQQLSVLIAYPGDSTTVDPTGAPYPMIVWGHRPLGLPTNFSAIASHLASWGYIVVVPGFVQLTNHQGNGADMKQVMNYLQQENNLNGASKFFQKINLSKIAVGGTAGGALSALYEAGSDRARVKYLLLVDPIDEAGAGAQTIRNLQVPSLHIRGEASTCNSSGSGFGLYGVANWPKMQVYIVSGSTCDMEDPVGPACELVCGTSTDNRRYLFRKYLTAFVNYFIAGDSYFLTYLTGPEAMIDVGQSLVQLNWSPDIPTINTPSPTPTAAPTNSRTPFPTATGMPTHTPRPTWTPSPTATFRPTLTPLPTATPRNSWTALPTPTPDPNRSATPTPSPTFTFTPQPTPMGPEPVVRWAGYYDTLIFANGGGRLAFLAQIIDRENDVQWVQLAYGGTLSGVLLYDNGTHGDWQPNDGFFTRDFGPLGDGAIPGRYVLELVAEDSAGHRGSNWPYLSVHP